MWFFFGMFFSMIEMMGMARWWESAGHRSAFRPEFHLPLFHFSGRIFETAFRLPFPPPILHPSHFPSNRPEKRRRRRRRRRRQLALDSSQRNQLNRWWGFNEASSRRFDWNQNDDGGMNGGKCRVGSSFHLADFFLSFFLSFFLLAVEGLFQSAITSWSIQVIGSEENNSPVISYRRWVPCCRFWSGGAGPMAIACRNRPWWISWSFQISRQNVDSSPFNKVPISEGSKIPIDWRNSHHWIKSRALQLGITQTPLGVDADYVLIKSPSARNQLINWCQSVSSTKFMFQNFRKRKFWISQIPQIPETDPRPRKPQEQKKYADYC